VADPGSTFATKSGLDDETSRFLIEMSLPALATIVLGFGASPACQKTNAGCNSSTWGMTTFSISVVVGCVGSSVTTLIAFCWVPIRSPILNVAVTSPFSPGSALFFALAAVQPHEVVTLLIAIGLSPLF